ncbi:MAG: hypothetical protein A2V70_09505 [Planctomycetes bacterium RBG_13_63_9]|nr:MAG: hypothetical protein A2V70_09505 [Planctomycetes bacterium RBG_13_63_9]
MGHNAKSNLLLIIGFILLCGSSGCQKSYQVRWNPYLCPRQDCESQHPRVCVVSDEPYGHYATCWHGWPGPYAGCPPCISTGGVGADTSGAAGPDSASVDRLPPVSGPQSLEVLPVPPASAVEGNQQEALPLERGQDIIPPPESGDRQFPSGDTGIGSPTETEEGTTEEGLPRDDGLLLEPPVEDDSRARPKTFELRLVSFDDEQGIRYQSSTLASSLIEKHRRVIGNGSDRPPQAGSVPTARVAERRSSTPLVRGDGLAQPKTFLAWFAPRPNRTKVAVPRIAGQIFQAD